MKTINIISLKAISGGLDNPIYTNTLSCSNDVPGSMVYGQDESKAYYLFFKGISGPEGVAYHMTGDFVFERSAHVEVTFIPVGRGEGRVCIQATEYPLTGIYS